MHRRLLQRGRSHSHRSDAHVVLARESLLNLRTDVAMQTATFEVVKYVMKWSHHADGLSESGRSLLLALVGFSGVACLGRSRLVYAASLSGLDCGGCLRPQL